MPPARSPTRVPKPTPRHHQISSQSAPHRRPLQKNPPPRQMPPVETMAPAKTFRKPIRLNKSSRPSIRLNAGLMKQKRIGKPSLAKLRTTSSNASWNAIACCYRAKIKPTNSSRASPPASRQWNRLDCNSKALTQAALQGLQVRLQGEFADIKNYGGRQEARQRRLGPLPALGCPPKGHRHAKKPRSTKPQQRQAQEAQAKFAKFADEQDKAFIARVPEFANKDKAAELQNAAMKTLRNIGFSDDELPKHWNKQESLSLRDARMQELIHKAARWDEAQEAKKTVTAKKDLPPVQRPGVARQGDSKLAQIQTIQKQLNNATGMAALRLATQLTKLQRESGPH